jgi:hypothetical protein
MFAAAAAKTVVALHRSSHSDLTRRLLPRACEANRIVQQPPQVAKQIVRKRFAGGPWGAAHSRPQH